MQVFYLFDSAYWNHSLDVALMANAVVFSYIAYSIITTKHLQSHPAPLIAALALGEATFAWMGVSRYLLCSESFGIQKIVATTIFFDPCEAMQLQVM